MSPRSEHTGCKAMLVLNRSRVKSLSAEAGARTSSTRRIKETKKLMSAA